MNRSNLAPVLLGVVVGMLAGLIYGWVVQPVRLVDTSPASLRTDFQDDYVALIAAAYAVTRDLPRAHLVVFPGAGHVPQEERPAAFNRLVSEFLGAPAVGEPV